MVSKRLSVLEDERKEKGKELPFMLPLDALSKVFYKLLQEQRFLFAPCGCRVQLDRLPHHHSELDASDLRRRLHIGGFCGGREQMLEAEGRAERSSIASDSSAAGDEGAAERTDDPRCEEEPSSASGRDGGGDGVHPLKRELAQNASLDCIIAGGPSDDGYLQVMCAVCNYVKGGLTMDEARLVVQHLLRA